MVKGAIVCEIWPEICRILALRSVQRCGVRGLLPHVCLRTRVFSFTVLDQDAFVATLQPRICSGSFESFLRQLNSYSFSKQRLAAGAKDIVINHTKGLFKKGV